jgi:hypothetical protein
MPQGLSSFDDGSMDHSPDQGTRGVLYGQGSRPDVSLPGGHRATHAQMWPRLAVRSGRWLTVAVLSTRLAA